MPLAWGKLALVVLDLEEEEEEEEVVEEVE